MVQPGVRVGTKRHLELVAEDEVLEGEVMARPQEGDRGMQKQEENLKHPTAYPKANPTQVQSEAECRIDFRCPSARPARLFLLPYLILTAGIRHPGQSVPDETDL